MTTETEEPSREECILNYLRKKTFSEDLQWEREFIWHDAREEGIMGILFRTSFRFDLGDYLVEIYSPADAKNPKVCVKWASSTDGIVDLFHITDESNLREGRVAEFISAIKAVFDIKYDYAQEEARYEFVRQCYNLTQPLPPYTKGNKP